MKLRTALVVPLALLAGLACQSPEASGSVGERRARLYSDRMEQGNRHFQRAEYEKASQDFRAATEYLPESAPAHNLLGMALVRLKSPAPAMASFQRAAELDRAYAPAWCNIGALHAGEKRFDLAKEALRKAIACQPDLASAHYSLGTLLVMLGEAEEGRACLLKAFELNPDFARHAPRSSVHVAELGANGVDMNLAFARIYASNGFSEELVHHLEAARQLGFSGWKQLLDEKAFEKVRDHPKVLALAR